MSSSSRAKPQDRLAKLYSKVASKILTESLHMNKGESLTIETWNNGQPFARTLAIEARKMGVIPLVVFEDEQAYIEGVKAMDKESRGKMGKHEYALLSGTDAYAFITSPALSAYYPGLTAEERVSSTAYNNSWYEAAEKAKLRGVRLSFGYTGKEMAKVLGKPVEKIVEHQLKAIVNADFASISNAGKQIAQYLQEGASCTLTSGKDSKLEFKMQGDTEIEDGIVDDADMASGSNMTYLPPGFVSKMIDSASVTGQIKGFATATPFGMIKDGSLEFESGKLVGWASKQSKKTLDKVIENIKEESRKVSLFTIGLNPLASPFYGIDRFVKGAVTLNMGFRLTPLLTKASISVNGKELVSSGKIQEPL